MEVKVFEEIKKPGAHQRAGFVMSVAVLDLHCIRRKT